MTSLDRLDSVITCRLNCFDVSFDTLRIAFQCKNYDETWIGVENRLGLKISLRHIKRKREKEDEKSNDFIVKLLGNFVLRNLSTVSFSTNVNLQIY